MEKSADGQTYLHSNCAKLMTANKVHWLHHSRLTNFRWRPSTIPTNSHVWGGAIDTCTRFSPFWTVSKDKRIATVLGYTGLGVAATRFGGQVMLDLLDGLDNERTRLEMVRKKPLAFPPEPFRYLIIQITRWSINRADEHSGKRNLWLRFLDRLGLGFDS